MTHYPLFDPHQIDVSVGYFDRKQCIEMNLEFAHAMLQARARGEEHFTIGPIVDNTVLFPAHFQRETIYSGIGSSAAMCAEEVGQHDGVSHTPTRIGGR